MAEAGQAYAHAKADAAGKTYEAAAAAASAAQQKSVLAAEALKAAESNASIRPWLTTLPRHMKRPRSRRTRGDGQEHADAALADAVTKLETAKTASAAKDAELADAIRRLNEATAASDAAANHKKEALRRAMPVSVLVSKKDRRIYVRQGLAPVFDAPISVRDPEKPLGSHLYIATAANDDGTGLKWSVVSMPEQGERGKNRPRPRNKPGRLQLRAGRPRPPPKRLSASRSPRTSATASRSACGPAAR